MGNINMTKGRARQEGETRQHIKTDKPTQQNVQKQLDYSYTYIDASIYRETRALH